MGSSAGPSLSRGRAGMAAAVLLAGGLAWAAPAPAQPAGRTAALTGVAVALPWASRFTLEAGIDVRGGWRAFTAQLRLVHWLPPTGRKQPYQAVGIGIRGLRFPITWETGTVALQTR
jgi:hypothetical protein